MSNEYKDYDYNQDIEIDKYSLDTECIDQPRKFMKWASLLADALKERDEAKQFLKVTETKISLEIRSDPKSFGLDKITESAVESVVINQKQVVEAGQRLIDAQYNVNILSAAKEAQEQRRSMLENLIKLFLSGYWAEPRIPQKEREEVTSVSTNEQKRELKKRMDKK